MKELGKILKFQNIILINQHIKIMKHFKKCSISISILAIVFLLSGCSENKNEIKFFASGTLDIGKNWDSTEKNLKIKTIFVDNKNEVGPILSLIHI